MGTQLDTHHILLQQSRKDSTSNALILHQVLEDNVVNRVCYSYHVYTFLTNGANLRISFDMRKYIQENVQYLYFDHTGRMQRPYSR